MTVAFTAASALFLNSVRVPSHITRTLNQASLREKPPWLRCSNRWWRHWCPASFALRDAKRSATNGQ